MKNIIFSLKTTAILLVFIGVLATINRSNAFAQAFKHSNVNAELVKSPLPPPAPSQDCYFIVTDTDQWGVNLNVLCADIPPNQWIYPCNCQDW